MKIISFKWTKIICLSKSLSKTSKLSFVGAFMITACTAQTASVSKTEEEGVMPKEFDPIIKALEKSATISNVGVVTRYFAPTGVITKASEVEERLMAKPSLCRSLAGRKNLFNKNGDGSEMYWVSSYTKGGECSVKLIPQKTNFEVLRVSSLSSNDVLENIASKIIEEEGIDIHRVSVYVNGDGDLVEARFIQNAPLNILHGNTGASGERLSISYVYNFSLGSGT